MIDFDISAAISFHIVQKLNRNFKKSGPNHGLFIQFGHSNL